RADDDYDGEDRATVLAENSLDYDFDGRTRSINGVELEYDAMGRLLVDASGKRVNHHGDLIVGYEDADGTRYELINERLGAAPLARATGSTIDVSRSWWGNSVGLVSDGGTVLGETSWSPYGAKSSETGEVLPNGYKGYWDTGINGFLHAYARTYDPVTRHFTTADPLHGNEYRPATMARRASFSGNPFEVTDIFGLSDECFSGYSCRIYDRIDAPGGEQPLPPINYGPESESSGGSSGRGARNTLEDRGVTFDLGSAWDPATAPGAPPAPVSYEPQIPTGFGSNPGQGSPERSTDRVGQTGGPESLTGTVSDSIRSIAENLTRGVTTFADNAADYIGRIDGIQFSNNFGKLLLGTGVGILQGVTPGGWLADAGIVGLEFLGYDLTDPFIDLGRGVGMAGVGVVETAVGGTGAAVGAVACPATFGFGCGVAGVGAGVAIDGVSNIAVGSAVAARALSILSQSDDSSPGASGGSSGAKTSTDKSSGDSAKAPATDATAPNWVAYPKHIASKKVPWSKIVDGTKHGPAKYKPGVKIEELERMVHAKGTRTTNGRPWKVMEFAEEIGANSGKRSRWVRVEESGGSIHGHPITHEQYLKLLK
ncbi:MAG: hypothetical protein AAFQ82_09895, partial [Myxococcota bacterium]